MLDVGSGSGILAIAALRLGVRAVVAVDTDPLAVEATRTNAQANAVADAIRIVRGTLPPEPAEEMGPFPLIAANLVAALLVELAAPLAAHLAPRGTLLASGIIEPRAAEVITALSAAGLEVVRRLDDGEWVSLRLVASG